MITNAFTLELDGKDWELKESVLGAAKPGNGPWIKAQVPGNVHLDLIKAGLLPDPHIADHEADMGWVEQRDWWYRRRFQASPQLLAHSKVFLKAAGLDTYATLWINGRKLGQSQNGLVEHEWELRRLLKSGANEILIRLASPVAAATALVKRWGPIPGVGDPIRVYTRKAQYSFGWDWGPRLPTAGIFKSIKLEGLSRARISDLRAVLHSADASKAAGLVELEIESLEARAATRLDLGLGPWSKALALKLKKGSNRVKVRFEIKNPRLWWPLGHGEPHLYNLVAELDSGAQASLAVGLKTVRLLRPKDAEGEAFILEVNGKKVFCKGANWIPADTFMGRVSEGRLRRLIAAAKAANMNLLRIWGGGFYESEEFYRACDEAGIMVWQDFPFACNEVPEFPWFAREVAAEARKAVTRIRRHPSLALWCGSNENHQARYDHWFRGREAKRWGLLYYHKVLPAICKELDPSTPYWPGSPFGGDNPNDTTRGDRHNWQVWGQYADILAYREDKGRFLSEFGFAALPGRPVIERMIPKAERFVQSRTMEAHDKMAGAGSFARIAFYINSHLPESSRFDDFRYLSQVMQSEALSTGLLHWRRRQFRTSGALFWQLNDCWPVTCWSVLDFDDKPKLGWHAARRCFDPLLLSAFEDLGPLRQDRTGRLPTRAKDENGLCQAWLSHEFDAAVSGSLKVELWDQRGRRGRVWSGRIKVPANASACVWQSSRAKLRVKDPASQYLVFHFEAPGLSRRAQLYFERPRLQSFQQPGLALKSKREKEVSFLELRASRLARYVELSSSKPGQFSDNGFDLLPGERRTIVFTPDDPGAGASFSVKTLNQIALSRS